jgi:hypothetical protein
MNHRLFILCFLLALTVLAACKKNYDVANTPVDPPYLNVVNATADTLDYFINGTRQNNQADITPGGATYYLSVLFGAGNYSFKKAGSSVTLFSTSYTLDTAANYTLFVCGETVGDAFIQQDNITQLTNNSYSDSSAVRFVNASPKAGTINFAVSVGTLATINTCAFKYTSNFMPIKDTVNEIKVTSSTGAQLLDTTFTFISGESYTVFTKGMPGGKGNSAFSMVQFVNGTAVITE